MKRIVGVMIIMCFATLIKAQDDPKFGKIKVRKYEEQQFYIELDSAPEYAKGPDALLDDIQAGIIYPEKAKTEKLEGTVLVKVIIDKYGNVINTSVQSSPNKVFDSAAKTAAKSLGKFVPHLESGKAVSAQFVLPVKFIL